MEKIKIKNIKITIDNDEENENRCRKLKAQKNFENSFPFLEYEKSTGLIDFIIYSAESFLFIWFIIFIEILNELLINLMI